MRTYEIFSGEDLRIADLILRRRMQMLVHSYLYYDKDTNLISDKQFDAWGKELVQLQNDYPNIASQIDYADAFSDWDASTGFHLPRNKQVQRIGQRLLSIDRSPATGVRHTVPVKRQVTTKKKSKSLF